MESWFDLVVDRKNFGRAIELSDVIRRHRFFSTLPLGGRLISFRWVIHAPDLALSGKAQAQRKDFLKRNPGYKSLMAKADLIRDSLKALPLQPDAKSKEANEQEKLLKELDEICLAQEAILASYALRREPAEMTFPPQMTLSEFREQIPKNQLMLITLRTPGGYHVFLLSAEAAEYVKLYKTRDIQREVSKLLKELNISEVASEVADFQKTEWQTTANEMKKRFFGGADAARWANYNELVVIPDGVLWYVPFEAFPLEDINAENNAEISKPGEAAFLGESIRVRYSPTLFLAAGAQRPWVKLEKSAAVVGRVFARTDEELPNAQFDELVGSLPGTLKFEKQIRQSTNLLASFFDQLIVWNEIRQTKNQPYALNPTQIDLSKSGSTLFDWMGLPWWGPKNLIMPFFHSDGGQGLRNRQDGNDLFLTSIGLMAAGTRTILLSRWSTGGKSSLDLTRMYASNLPRFGPQLALREAIRQTRKMDLVYEQEPRVRFNKKDPVLKANHPYFWSAHMLLAIPDSGMPEDVKAQADKELADLLANAQQNPNPDNENVGQQAPEENQKDDKSDKGQEDSESTANSETKPKRKGLFAKPKDDKGNGK